jgi:hypothetical protein
MSIYHDHQEPRDRIKDSLHAQDRYHWSTICNYSTSYLPCFLILVRTIYRSKQLNNRMCKIHKRAKKKKVNIIRGPLWTSRRGTQLARCLRRDEWSSIFNADQYSLDRVCPLLSARCCLHSLFGLIMQKFLTTSISEHSLLHRTCVWWEEERWEESRREDRQGHGPHGCCIPREQDPSSCAWTSR